MTAVSTEQQSRVTSLRRYPVKSMLGETVSEFSVGSGGVDGDRRFALIDRVTGRVASAKQARLWRNLLQCRARTDGGRVWIALPDGTEAAADDDRVEELLSALLSRPVQLSDTRPEGASVERADPEQVMRQGLDAEVDAPLLELGEGTPGDSFVDLAPLHVITTATIDHIGVEVERYRPNIVVATRPGHPPYSENEWTGRILTVGGVQLRGMGPTPRCVIPTLEQAGLGRSPEALRTPTAENRVESFGLGRLPCAGSYMEVVVEGTVRVDDQVTLA
ncbi:MULTISPECIES: MOSC domain-containing protein [Mycobacteriaceae]|uniref:MOSC domain-containing protein n=1 Tax=Mycobacteriaceae TaxID=1762 RepID=UPI000800C923|nr:MULTISPECIES: MOSC N-terminal beta barrel domain-containing protein [Mycobacteriaceae]MCK0177465.1 MOSC domain-containing protein [Mycolicibacterium sp. F2034L]OBB61536.1 molybdenum cofactor biosysynthesis protein [Mycobacterium sp. 852013-51886_SCH5428379]